ncbi:MAG: hypothetical protein OHK0039_17710 [Bacteroidia bacterium]
MELIFPAYPLQIEQRDGKPHIWDVIRKKWIVLQKEEYVRQHLLHYLLEARATPASRIAVEREIRYGSQRKRFDVVVFDRSGRPWLLCECKSPDVPLSEATLLQAARYNRDLEAPHFLLTNGTNLHLFSRDAHGLFQRINDDWFDAPTG